MLNAQLFREDSVLMVTPIDEINLDDFEQIRHLVNPYIEEYGPLHGLLIDAHSYFSWEDFTNLLSQLHFINSYEKSIERVAIVTDNEILAFLPRLASSFINAELKHFIFQDREKARTWLRTGAEVLH
jgi:hypothetical protein